MRSAVWIVLGCMMCGALFQSAVGQPASTSQSVTLTVSPIARISVSGDPGAMTISTGTAGSDNLAYAGDSATTYSITHNSNSNLRITAAIDAALSAGYSLSLRLASTRGSSAGFVDISSATSAVDVVTGIARGADAGEIITYRFNALASSGAMAATTRTVTLTITN